MKKLLESTLKKNRNTHSFCEDIFSDVLLYSSNDDDGFSR